MSEFFHSTWFMALLTQSVAFLCDEYSASLMNKRGLGATPLFYESCVYRLYRILTIAITIVSVIICSFHFSWWLLIVFPLVDIVSSTLITSIIVIPILKILGCDISRFIAMILTLVFDIILILMWF